MSKGMEALRRSKASAGGAPNLPPHIRPDVFLPPSLMKLLPPGSCRWRRGSRLCRQASTAAPADTELASGSLLVFRPALPLVDPYSALYGREPERGMPRAATYELSTQESMNSS